MNTYIVWDPSFVKWGVESNFLEGKGTSNMRVNEKIDLHSMDDDKVSVYVLLTVALFNLEQKGA